MPAAHKRLQYMILWLLPLVVIGGSFWPLLGYLVVGMMAIMLTISVFGSRYWCSNLCPRGAFLDIALSRASMGGKLPKTFANSKFRWGVFFGLMAFLSWKLIASGGTLLGIGLVFVTMCLITTVLAIIIGVPMNHRGWCVICPMGTMQDAISKLNRKKKGATPDSSVR